MNKSTFLHPTTASIRSVLVIVVLIALGISMQAPSGRAQSPLTITQPSGPVVLSEDLDYMAHNWHDAWDMNDELDIHLFTSPTCDGMAAMFSNVSFSSGVWSGTYTTNDPWLWLLDPGYRGALHVGKDGNVHPIDANIYTQLTFRMYLSPGFDPTATPGAKLAWTRRDAYSLPFEPTEFGMSYFFRVYPGWNIYTIDLTQIGLQQGNLHWGGPISGLRLYTGLLSAGTNVQIDWVRLTAKPTRTVAAWSGSWPDASSAEVLFSVDGTTYDPLMVYTNNQIPDCAILKPDVIPAGDNGYGSYVVPASFPPGSVYLQVRIDEVTSGAAGPWQFNARPSLTIVSPSYTSGEDFATSVVGNPWDMSDAADIADGHNLAGAPMYASGISTAKSTDVPCQCSMPWGDPQLDLNMGGNSVDTSKYRYLTIKVKVNASFDFGNGWVSRFIWAQGNYNTHGVGNDMPLYEGWNTFHVDMWGDIQDDEVPGNAPWRSVSPTILRFDPHEIPPSTQFEVDYIKLTAVNEANASFDIRWDVSDPKDNDVTITIWFTTDGPGTTGTRTGDRTLIATIQPDGRVIHPARPSPMTVASQSSGNYKIYVPLIMSNYTYSPPPPPCEGNCYRWDTSGWPEGTYYIHIDADDGHSVTSWCSDIPVVIKH